MSRVRVRPTVFHLVRVAAFVFLLLLIAGAQPFSRAPSSLQAAQGPTATPNPLAIPPGSCTHDALNALVQAVIQTWTDTGAVPVDMLRTLLDGLSTCYTDLNVSSVTTCDQPAVQRVNLFILVSLITRQSLNGAEIQALLQVLNTCYGFDLNVDAVIIAGSAGGGGNSGGNGGGSNGGVTAAARVQVAVPRSLAAPPKNISAPTGR